jgi:putative Holliday junction resolvase
MFALGERKPPSMHILGLGVGNHRIGVAISDALGATVQGLMLLERRTQQANVVTLQQVTAMHQIGRIVVGIPRNMDGS